LSGVWLEGGLRIPEFSRPPAARPPACRPRRRPAGKNAQQQSGCHTTWCSGGTTTPNMHVTPCSTARYAGCSAAKCMALVRLCICRRGWPCASTRRNGASTAFCPRIKQRMIFTIPCGLPPRRHPRLRLGAPALQTTPLGGCLPPDHPASLPDVRPPCGIKNEIRPKATYLYSGLFGGLGKRGLRRKVFRWTTPVSTRRKAGSDPTQIWLTVQAS
jgi:hypothetical protein